MNRNRILIVEDEVLIADALARYLTQRGYQVVGAAISYAEAEALYRRESPDLILLDIRLHGARTGIDFAHFLRKEPRSIPFVYLTSQLDSRSIDLAKETFPAGYLSKPVQKESLYATIEMALHAYVARSPAPATIILQDGGSSRKASIDDILYVQADHVYVQVYVRGGDKILQRRSLTDFLQELPADRFVQTHRSYAVNVRQVSGWDGHFVYIDEQAIPLSRSRRKEVLDLLER